MNKFFRDFCEYWNLLFIFALLIFIFQHFYFGLVHFHDCDSSVFYEYLDKTSISRMRSFIDKFSPSQLVNIRYFFADLSQKISFLPFKKFIQLSYVSTYPPMMGFIFGFIKRETYESFYYFSSLITGFSLALSSIFMYLTFLNLKLEKKISFGVCTLLLTLYATNSYSYHLGSSIWYLFSISLGIFLLTFQNKFLKDLFSFLLQFLSYPYIVWLCSQFIITAICTLYYENINLGVLKYKGLRFLKDRFLTIFGLTLNILLFVPTNSGYRYGPDLRGFFTIFSFNPLNDEPLFFTILFSIFLYLLFSLAINSFFGKIIKTFFFDFKSFKSKLRLTFKSFFMDERSKVFLTCFSFLIIFFILVLLRKLTFTTTRHGIFILPAFLILVALGADELTHKIKEINALLSKKLISLIILSFVVFSFFISNYSSIQRVDILKKNGIPNSIINFIKNSENVGYSIIGCSPHYKYSNFDESKFSYNRKEPHILSDLYKPGKKLLISQRPIISKSSGEFNNELGKYLFFGSPSLGDEINVFSKNVKIKVISDPVILKTNVYYDALNKNSKKYNLFHLFNKLKTFYIIKFDPNKIKSNNLNNLAIYDWYDFYSKATGAEYRYSRPNDIWLIPIIVENFSD